MMLASVYRTCASKREERCTLGTFIVKVGGITFLRCAKQFGLWWCVAVGH